MKQLRNRLVISALVGSVALLAGCGSSTSSSGQPHSNQVFSMVVSPTQMTLNSGDWASITATVDVSTNNGTPTPLTPQPTFKFFSSDSRVTVSPAGVVCAGQWDAGYSICKATVFGLCMLDANGNPVIDPNTQQCVPNPLAGQLNLPSGFVTITVFSASRNVSGTMQVSVHPRAARIALSAPNWPIASAPSGLCISQNNQLQFVAQAVDANGNAIPSCTASPGNGGCINDNDYIWTTDNSNVAQVSLFGTVVARNPGVANVFANLNGTVSQPLAFATCPPSSIILSTSEFTNANPVAPFTTADLTLSPGDRKYVTASLIDINGNSLITSPLSFLSSNPLSGSFGAPVELSYPSATPGGTPVTKPAATLTANSPGRFSMLAACTPPACNPAVAQFTTPGGTPVTGQQVGFGYPVYSNPIGASVQGASGSQVLVAGTSPSGSAFRMQVFDSESMLLIQTVVLTNAPNSLVVAPNGATAYIGSSAGLTVVNLSPPYLPLVRTFPITGQPNTVVITGTVLGVSPDNRFVVVSDVANSFVYLIDTTGTKAATRYNISNITSVTFAADDSNIWIGGTAGVYVFQANTFVPLSSYAPNPSNLSSNVTSLAWMPDGQSYFASGDQLVNYSTCNNIPTPHQPSPNQVSTATTPNPAGVGVPMGLATTVVKDVTYADTPHLVGLDGNTWFDYPVTSSAEVADQTAQAITDLTPNGTGDVCLSVSTVTVNTPTTATAGLSCTAQQLSFAPKLQEAFVTGVDPACATAESNGSGGGVIHGYDLASGAFTLNTTNPVIPLSGGVLNDGRKLFFGTNDNNSPMLHRVDLATGTGAVGTRQEDDSIPVDVVPSFVAVVPK